MKTTTTASPPAGQSCAPQLAPTRQIWQNWGHRLAAKTAASLAALLLGAGSSYAITAEFVVNSGFESPGTDATAPPWYNQAAWGGCTGAAVATEAHSGLQSWATSGAAAGAIDCVEQAVPIMPGGLKYAVSYWVKIPSASEASPAKVDIRAWFGTPSNLYIKDFWSAGGASGISITTPDWIQITDGVGGWTPTAECSQVLLRCRITSNDPSMAAYVDDASVTTDVSYATVSGTVTEGGVGVAGAIVKATLTTSSTSFSTSAPSASDGSYSLQVVVGYEYQLSASALPFGSAVASAPAPFTAGDTTPITGKDLLLGPGAIRYEAENAALVGCAIQDHGNASNGKRVAATVEGNNGTVTFALNVPAAGLYPMVMGYFQPWNPSRDTYVTLNGSAVGTLAAPNVADPNYGTASMLVSLNAGSNTLVLSNGSGWGPHWDYIEFQPAVESVTVSGAVTDEGAGVAGAIVRATQTANPAVFSTSAPSAADGSYSLQVIVGNEYKLTASALPAGRAVAAAPSPFTPVDTTALTGMDLVLGPLPGFSGYYAPANWDPILSVSDDPNPGIPAKVNTGEAPAAITLSAQQGTMWSGGTSFYLIPVPASGALEFDWEYTAGIPNDSSVGYAVNPAIASWGDAGQWDNPGGHSGCTVLSGRNGSANSSGHVSIMVNAGDMIGFWAHNAFYNAAAQIRVLNFVAPDGVFHPITATAGPGGTVSPLGTVIAPDGLNRTFTITPSHGFSIADVLVDGASAGALATYTFVGVTTDEHTIEAQFMELGKYSISVSATAGGTITPSETVTLYEGDSQAYTITPNQYFDVTSVLVNDATEVSSGSSAQTYTLSNVNSNSTIAVVFTGWVLTEISGVITLDGAGVEGVAVTASGPRGPFTATTGSDGTYAIQVRPGDTYTLTARKSGYIATPDSLTAGPGDLTGKDFTVVVNPPHPQPMFVSRGTGNWRNDTWTIGSRIKTGASVVFVSQLGYVDKDLDGLNVTHQVGIWDQAGVLLGSVTVPAGSGAELIGDFRYAPLDTLITLQPNSTYALGGFTQGDDWPDQAPAPGFNDPDFADFICEQAIAHDGGAGFSNPNPNGGGFDWGASCAACNLIGTTLSGEDPYTTWISRYPSLIGAKALPGADPDGDGMANQDEFAFGLNPTLTTSVNPIVAQLNKTSGQFSYTRDAASGLTYTVWTSANLVTWTKDAGATQAAAAPVNGVETVAVTLSGTKPLTPAKLFVRVAAQ